MSSFRVMIILGKIERIIKQVLNLYSVLIDFE